jgi:hypothetical protein
VIAPQVAFDGAAFGDRDAGCGRFLDFQPTNKR